MGGSTSKIHIDTDKKLIIKIIERAKQERKKIYNETVINDYLRELLVSFNDRDTEQTREHLEHLHELLGDEFEIEQLLLGGSVAKHTYVDGLSDIDALIILNRKEIKGLTPQEVIAEFNSLFQNKLTADIVNKIKQGEMAITITYKDNIEIQILPALRKGRQILISDNAGKEWSGINPSKFKDALTTVNQDLNHALVPAIKLIKSINSNRIVSNQLTGYHIESLALDVFKGYEGPKTPKAMLSYFYSTSPDRIKWPISDMTGQSNKVDEYLGGANSSKRKSISLDLTNVGKRINSATEIDQWDKIING